MSLVAGAKAARVLLAGYCLEKYYIFDVLLVVADKSAPTYCNLHQPNRYWLHLRSITKDQYLPNMGFTK